MKIWSNEIDELSKFYISISGKLSDLERELAKLLKANDEVDLLFNTRRCLEVIVREVCQQESLNLSNIVSLKGLINKLNKEDKVPQSIVIAMLNLNNVSTNGTHPKELAPLQVKAALNDLNIILEWYIKLKEKEFNEDEAEHLMKFGKLSEILDISKPFHKKDSFRISVILILILTIPLFIFSDHLFVSKKDKFQHLQNEKGRITLAVMPFINMTNDSLWDIWENGIQNELISRLSDSRELAVRQYISVYDVGNVIDYKSTSTLNLSTVSEYSKKLNVNAFIVGSIKKGNELIRINAQMVNTNTSEVYNSFFVEARNENGILILTDSLSRLIKDFLEIKALKENTSGEADYSLAKSPQAFKFFIKGVNAFYKLDYPTAKSLLNQAVELDSNFIAARTFLIIANRNSRNKEEARKHLEIAVKRMEQISYTEQLNLKFVEALIDKKPHEYIKYLEELTEFEHNKVFWAEMGRELYITNQFAKSAECFEKAFEIDKQLGGNWNSLYAYMFAGMANHKIEKHYREKQICEQGLEVLPDHPEIIYQLAVCSFSQKDMIKGQEYLERYMAIREKEGWHVYEILSSIGEIYGNAGLLEFSEEFFYKAIDVNPKYIEAKLNLAYLYCNNEVKQKAGVELIEEIYSKYPDNSFAIYMKGMSLYRQENYEEALEFLNKSWEQRSLYNHEHRLMIEEVESILRKNK